MEEIQSFQELLEGLDRQTGSHQLSELDMNENPKMFVQNLLEDYPEHEDIFCSSLVNDFSDSMQTRAREEGKYAVLITMPDSILICHTDSKEKSMDREINIFERLLDTDNVDKYVRFTQGDDEVTVDHFERYSSESLAEWLGLARREIAYEEAVDIKIYTVIDDATCVFEYTKEEFEHNFLIEESFELVGDILRTPQNEYPVTQIKLGRRKFDTVDEFLQEFYGLYYDLNTYKAQYDNIANSMGPWETQVIDRENCVTKGVERETIILKTDADLNILFANNIIELSASWRLDLLQKFDEGTQTRFFHAGMPFSEEPVNVGPFQFHNEIGNENVTHLDDLYQTAQQADTGGTLSSIIYFVIFSSLSEWSERPISHFFTQLGDKYRDELDAEVMVLRDEDDVLEFKSRDWLSDDLGLLAD